MPIENHPTAAISEWLTLAISLEGGPRSVTVDPATLHPTFEAAQTHLIDVARLLFAAASVDPDEIDGSARVGARAPHAVLRERRLAI
jgi:hypothetical protein